jgi:hypothetical protein
MSVSLALVPVALALRVVMGKENFHRWVDSMLIRVPTTFESAQDLIRQVKTAGYDAKFFGGSIKTHIANRGQFVFWEPRDGVWTAVFSSAYGPEPTTRFMQELEDRIGRQVFVRSANGPALVPPTDMTFPTNFRDGALLTQALTTHGVRPQVELDGTIVAQVSTAILRFTGSEGSPYQVQVLNAPSIQGVFQYLSELEDDYRERVQAATYTVLRQRIVDTNLRLETEEILEDNTIVLTLSVKE